MTGFIAIGIVGLVIVLASLVLGEIVDGVFDALNLDTGSGLFSAPVIGSFLAAFGFGAALIMYATGVGVGLGAVGGLGTGAGVAGVAYLLTRTLMRMPTDEPVRVVDLVGERATVVTPIPADGLGEVTLVYRGQFMKLSARASGPVASGTAVTVTAVTSPSSVMVKEAAS